jgi:hypothetical protein
MRHIQIAAIAIILAGCAAGTGYKLPAPAPIDEPPATATRPIPLPERPEIAQATIDGQAVGYLTRDGLLALTAYGVAADANTDLAELNAIQAEKIAAAYGELAAAYQRQREISAIREDLLNQERRGRFIDGLFYKAMIGLGVVAAIVAN